MMEEQRKWEEVADKHLSSGNIDAANVAWRLADLAEADEVIPGLGEHDSSLIVCHDSHMDWDTCLVPNGEHECLQRVPHGHEPHECACGFEWKRKGV